MGEVPKQDDGEQQATHPTKERFPPRLIVHRSLEVRILRSIPPARQADEATGGHTAFLLLPSAKKTPTLVIGACP
jgi:hypothetical protein